MLGIICNHMVTCQVASRSGAAYDLRVHPSAVERGVVRAAGVFLPLMVLALVAAEVALGQAGGGSSDFGAAAEAAGAAEAEAAAEATSAAGAAEAAETSGTRSSC
jgi:hypothetical protein